MTSKLLPRDVAPLPQQRPLAVADSDIQVADLPVPRPDRALSVGLLLTILFFGIPLLLYCVLTSG